MQGVNKFELPDNSNLLQKHNSEVGHLVTNYFF